MFDVSRPLRIGTRGSPLALTQARMTADALIAAHGLDPAAVVLVPVRTSGDRIQDRPLAEVGGKALWTRELDRALADDVVDIAVHSMKDVETIRPDWIVRAAVLPRGDVRDRLIGAESIAALAEGARVGTSSPRRRAQLLRERPDLAIVLFRGNVDTRLAKLAGGEADATLLAAAGLDRLGRDAVGTAVPVETMLPAPAQGAVGIETLAARADLVRFVGAISDPAAATAVSIERAFLAALGGDCRSPIAALATLDRGRMTLAGEILDSDGRESVADRIEVTSDGGLEAAGQLARTLLARASPALAALFSPPA